MAPWNRRRPNDTNAPAPVAKAVDDPTVEIGASGLRQQSGVVMEEYDRNLQGAKWHGVVREMVDGDAVVGAIAFLLRMYLQGADWTVTPYESGSAEHEANAEFVESCMNDMTVPWSGVVDDVWTMLWYGWSWLEPVYKPRQGPADTPGKSSNYTDGKWGWRKLAYRSQQSFVRWEFDESGGIVGWWQQIVGGEQVLLPIGKGLHFRTTRAGGNPEGRSVLRSAYTAWWYRKRIREVEGIGIERDLTGFPVVYVPPRVLAEGGTALDGYTKMVRDIRVDEQMGAVLPAQYDEHGNPLVKLELLASPGSRSVDPGAVIERYSREIAMSVLSDVILLGHSNTGTYALSVTKDEMLKRSLQAWLDDVADVFNRYELPRLFALNGNKSGQLPRLTARAPESPDVGKIVDALYKLAQSGAMLWPSPELAEWVEEQTGIPVPDTAMDEMVPAPPPILPPPGG